MVIPLSNMVEQPLNSAMPQFREIQKQNVPFGNVVARWRSVVTRSATALLPVVPGCWQQRTEPAWKVAVQRRLSRRAALYRE